MTASDPAGLLDSGQPLITIDHHPTVTDWLLQHVQRVEVDLPDDHYYQVLAPDLVQAVINAVDCDPERPMWTVADLIDRDGIGVLCLLIPSAYVPALIRNCRWVDSAIDGDHVDLATWWAQQAAIAHHIDRDTDRVDRRATVLLGVTSRARYDDAARQVLADLPEWETLAATVTLDLMTAAIQAGLSPTEVSTVMADPGGAKRIRALAALGA